MTADRRDGGHHPHFVTYRDHDHYHQPVEDEWGEAFYDDPYDDGTWDDLNGGYEDDSGQDWDSGEPETDPGRARRSLHLSRRGFLGVAGIGGAAAALATTAPPVFGHRRRGDGGRDGGRDRDGGGRDGDGSDGGRGGGGNGNGGGGSEAAAPTRFSRMFGDLPPFAEASDGLRQALTELGAAGGLLDALDPLDAGAQQLATDPALSANNPDNPANTAGTTFLGQFIDHDLTLDVASTLGQPLSLNRSANMRTPSFDLDSVYGGGPAESPQLYTTDPIRFRVESGGLFEDVPRDGTGAAVIADPRNDENLVICGLQAAFLMFHNAVAEQVEATGLEGIDAFNEAQRLVRWHWQWIVIHEHLPQIVPAGILDDMAATGPQFFDPGQGSIPVEFSTSAYRFGHAQVNPSLRANMAGDGGQPFFAFVFDPTQIDGPDPDSLVGGRRAARRFIGWQTFFDFGDGQVANNKRVNTTISTPLFQLPAFVVDSGRGGDPGPLSLATRNLLRHLTFGVPSGQAVASAMGAEQLSPADLADLEPFGNNLASSTPLWFYVLREAQVIEDGLRLGPVGGRIVAEVFTTLLALDPTSFPGAEPGFTPTLPSSAGAGEFRMVDLLTMAGVDPASRGQ